MGVNMLLTIGGVILFSTFVLYANGLLSDNTAISSDNEYVITAIALGQSVIDEAKTKAFDENVIAGPPVSEASFTAVNALGPEAGEAVALPDTAQNAGAASFAAFDDIDDYNGYVRIVHTPRAENYRVTSSVVYASETNPDSTRSTPTYCKRMMVTVSSPYFKQPVALSYAFTY
jgi:hypothetical protein